MVAAAVQINAVTGSNTDLPINTLVSLTNADNTGVTTWAWTIVDQPPGTADNLSATNVANPTFTPKKEGTYLLRLVVNAGTGTEAQNQVVAAVRQLKTRTRVPAAGETSEGDAADGWAVHVDELLRLVDTLRADPGVAVLWTTAARVANDVVFVSGEQVLKSGLPGQETVGAATQALGTTAAHCTHPLFVVVGAVDGGNPTNELFYARRFGRVAGLAGAPAVGDYVYLSDAGVPALTAGTFRRVLGRVISVGGGFYAFWFDGAMPTENVPTPLVVETYAAAQGDMAGAANIGTGCSFGKRFPATPASLTFTILDSNNIVGPTVNAWQTNAYGTGAYAVSTGAGNTRFYTRVIAV